MSEHKLTIYSTLSSGVIRSTGPTTEIRFRCSCDHFHKVVQGDHDFHEILAEFEKHKAEPIREDIYVIIKFEKITNVEADRFTTMLENSKASINILMKRVPYGQCVDPVEMSIQVMNKVDLYSWHQEIEEQPK